MNGKQINATQNGDAHEPQSLRLCSYMDTAKITDFSEGTFFCQHTHTLVPILPVAQARTPHFVPYPASCAGPYSTGPYFTLSHVPAGCSRQCSTFWPVSSLLLRPVHHTLFRTLLVVLACTPHSVPYPASCFGPYSTLCSVPC